jgi:uncharacterized protein YkwD
VVTPVVVPAPAPVTTYTPPAVVTTPAEVPSPIVAAAPTTYAAPEPTPTPAAAAPSAPSDDSYEGTVLYHHNVHRANHSAPDVTYNDEIAGYAAQVAKSCKFAHDL